MDWDEMSNPYRGPSIDASYQVSVQRTRFLEIDQLVKEIRKLKSQDSQTSECLRFTG
jgi:hypothetical protein